MNPSLVNRIRAGGGPPAHVAVIMDGNGRWAGRRGRRREYGHRAGVLALRDVVSAALEVRLPVLTVFAFSDENWRRPPAEVTSLMSLLELHLRREVPELKRRGVCARVLGRTRRLPPRVRWAITLLERETRQGKAMRLNFALSYGARREMARAARRLAREVADGRLDPEGIDEGRFAAHLYTEGLPDPELLIRTSGEHRLSNFLLWQTAHARIRVSPLLWPDFSGKAFLEMILDDQLRAGGNPPVSAA